MRGEEQRQGPMLMVVNVEQRIARDYPLRRIKQMADAVLKDLSPVFDRCTARWTAVDSARASAQGLAADGAVHGA
jgi:hypothetical protein